VRALSFTTVALGSSFLLACASTHDIQKDGINPLGGGYIESKLAAGIHHISVKTNVAPWVNLAGVRSSWRGRAEALCGPAEYREVDVKEDSYEHAPAFLLLVPYIVTTREGYAVCKDINLSDDEAMALIGRRKNK